VRIEGSWKGAIVKKTLFLVGILLALAFPVTAQQVQLDGNISSTEVVVSDSIGVQSALMVGTAGISSTGTLAVTGQFSFGTFDAMLDDVILCGDQANNGEIFFGPALGSIDGTYTDSSIASTACDALDDATEATADEAIGFANQALTVYGMVCEVSGSGSNGVTITARSAEANLSPSLACTIATTETTCAAALATPATVAAGATIAVSVVNTEDLSLQDGWCKLYFGFVP
jgi:hypothetical protein